MTHDELLEELLTEINPDKTFFHLPTTAAEENYFKTYRDTLVDENLESLIPHAPPLDTEKSKMPARVVEILFHYRPFYYSELSDSYFCWQPSQRWLEASGREIQQQMRVWCEKINPILGWYYPTASHVTLLFKEFRIFHGHPMETNYRRFEQTINGIAAYSEHFPMVQIFDLEEGQWRDAEREDYVKRTCLDYIPCAPAKPHEYDRFPHLYHYSMWQMFPKKEDRDWVEAFMFYCLTHRVNLKAHLILVGSGDDGKSRFGWFLRQLLGEMGTTADLNILFNPSGHGRTLLKGKTLAVCDEFPEDTIPPAVVGAMKNTTGAADVTINPKGLSPYMAKVYAKLLILSNRLPTFSGAIDMALMGRFKIIWLRSFYLNHVDPNLRIDPTRWEDIVSHERGGILDYLFQKYSTTFAQFLVIDREETKRRWVELGGNVVPFLNDVIEECPWDQDAHIQKNILFERYTNWCKDKHEKPLEKPSFYNAVNEHGHPTSRPRIKVAADSIAPLAKTSPAFQVIRPRCFMGMRWREGTTEEESHDVEEDEILIQIQENNGVMQKDLEVDYPNVYEDYLMEWKNQGLIYITQGRIKWVGRED